MKKKNFSYHLIPGDFEEFDFNKLSEENDNSKNYDGILWKNASYDSKNNIIKTDLKMNIGDIVYIYYKNLPDRISRILVKCTVKDTFENNKDCFYYENEIEKNEIESGIKDKLPAVLLKFENSINVKNNINQFSRKNLIDKYSIKNIQGKQHLKAIHEKLLSDLDKVCSKKVYTLNDLRDYMNEISQCEFQKSKYLRFRSQNHSTFIKENHLNYYEKHHIIQQFNLRTNEKFPKKYINDSRNIINLCPTCHKKIHNGIKEDREKMVRLLYEKKDGLKELIDEIPKELKKLEKSDEDWLIQQYFYQNKFY